MNKIKSQYRKNYSIYTCKVNKILKIQNNKINR